MTYSVEKRSYPASDEFALKGSFPSGFSLEYLISIFNTFYVVKVKNF